MNSRPLFSTQLEQLMSNPDYQAKIFLPNGTVVKGFLEADFSFGGQADYASMSDAMGDSQGTLQSGMNVATAAKNSVTGGNSSAPVLKSFVQTVLDFVGTGSTEFQINIKLIATRPTDNVVAEYKKLIPAVFSEGGGSLQLMKAPFGYARSLTTMTAGGCTLAIGSWFRASKLLIKSVTPSFSREIISNGTPLSATIAITLTMFRSPSAEDVQGWFRK